MRVILDTNFLLIPGQFGIDIFAELERLIIEKFDIIVFSNVRGELEAIADSRKADAPWARLALGLIKAKGAKIVRGEGPVDSAIRKAAGPGDIVGTNDRKLRAALKARGARLIGLKGKSHLDFV